MIKYTDEEILKLIGRKQININLLELEQFYKDKIILVTGGAGSIGSEIVRLLLDLKVKQIIVLDWWENGMFYLKESIDSNKVVYIIGDIKTRKVSKVLHQYRPTIIIHAAAYKHCPLMQDNPMEAYNNNVWGTLNLMQEAIKFKCKNFISISTDKAVNPSSIMGVTKRFSEILLQKIRGGKTIFSAVRFGNVIQSNGSVVPIFLKQIEEEKDLKVTDKKITRYFMTKREAVELVLLSGTIAKNGRIFLLDMGKPVKILDLAKALIKDTGSKSKIIITGLRKGEKMFEELLYKKTDAKKTKYKKIFMIKRKNMGDGLEIEIRKMIRKSLHFKVDDEDIYKFVNKLGFKIKQ